MDEIKKDQPVPCAACGCESAEGESICSDCADELLGKHVSWELI